MLFLGEMLKCLMILFPPQSESQPSPLPDPSQRSLASKVAKAGGKSHQMARVLDRIVPNTSPQGWTSGHKSFHGLIAGLLGQTFLRKALSAIPDGAEGLIILSVSCLDQPCQSI